MRAIGLHHSGRAGQGVSRANQGGRAGRYKDCEHVIERRFGAATINRLEGAEEDWNRKTEAQLSTVQRCRAEIDAIDKICGKIEGVKEGSTVLLVTHSIRSVW